MTDTQFIKYKELKDRREALEDQIKALNAKTSHNDKPIIECGWLMLTYGNGSNRNSVCNNPYTLHKIKELLLEEQNKELADIIKQMGEL